ncbi:ArnT family glycosyltransferase [Planctomycetota bacterium]
MTKQIQNKVHNNKIKHHRGPVKNKSSNHRPVECRAEELEKRPDFCQKYFRLMVLGIILVSTFTRAFDFTLIKPSYKGLYITQPYIGLHSWHYASQSWAARSHVKYGLGYTKGYRTLVVGDPPPEYPLRYVSHPPLETLVTAAGMLLLGTELWQVRLFDLILSVPMLAVVIYVLRRLFGCSFGLLAGLMFVLLPIFSFFAFDLMMITLWLWALYRCLILTRRLQDGPEPKLRHLIELAAG